MKGFQAERLAPDIQVTETEPITFLLLSHEYALQCNHLSSADPNTIDERTASRTLGKQGLFVLWDQGGNGLGSKAIS